MNHPTPTIDHQDPAPGECGRCMAHRLCPACMGKLQRLRHDWAMDQWLANWGGTTPRPSKRGRPQLRLVLGGG
jgi:hypothetical protein